MVRFRHRTDLGGGDALLVAPLHADWVPDAAELLASSFADSLAASLYKRYLQRQIKAYLEAHINLPPKAVVLAALHMPRELAEAAEAEARALAEAAQSAAAAGTLAAWPSSSAGNMSSSVENGLPSSSGSTTTTTSISSSSSSSNSSGVQLGGLDSALSSCDVDVEATAAALQLYGNSNGMLGSSGSSSEAAATVAGSIPAPATALATVGSGSLLAPGSGAVLTSVLELSFSPSTRSKHLTLQSPDVRSARCCGGWLSFCCCCGAHFSSSQLLLLPGWQARRLTTLLKAWLACRSAPEPLAPLQLVLQSRPYLCNMAVAEVHRRRGYGLALLTAAEALVRSLGENEIYLHTRWVLRIGAVQPELCGSCGLGCVGRHEAACHRRALTQGSGRGRALVYLWRWLLQGTSTTEPACDLLPAQPTLRAAAPALPAGCRTRRRSCCMPKRAMSRWQQTLFW